MKLNKVFVLLIASLFIFVSACEDRSDLTAPEAPNTGTANFTTYVTLGNSLTAGFADNSLYQSAQMYSYGNQIAGAVQTGFVQPLISDPGIPGRLEIQQFVIADGEIASVVMASNTQMGSALNIAHAAPYNNLGVPGAILYDMVDETNFASKSVSRGNPYFQLVLRDAAFGASIVKQAINLSPTFVSLWIGNNDVLGYASSGGTSGTDATGKLPTDPNVFQSIYQQIGAALAATGASVVVANIPDISSVPFFNTVGPVVALNLQPYFENPQFAGVFYQENGVTGASTTSAGFNALVTGAVRFTLVSAPYAALIGQSTGQFYRDYGYPGIPAGIDTTQPFGLHPQNPWPDAFVLDAAEQTTIANHVTSFNNTIQAVASANGFGYVDINAAFKDIKAAEASGGKVYNGVAFTTRFLSGGIFSLDGVHPTAQGQAIIANEFIKVINTKFSASIPLINIAEVPGSINLAKAREAHPELLPIFENMQLDDLIF